VKKNDVIVKAKEASVEKKIEALNINDLNTIIKKLDFSQQDRNEDNIFCESNLSYKLFIQRFDIENSLIRYMFII
jgi:hypothetical protein